jgi:hypothetical protein
LTEPRIDSFRFGQIVIDGQIYRQDVIILPDRVLPNWWRVKGHKLCYEDLQQALQEKPQTVIIGCGVFQRITVPDEVCEQIEARGACLVALRTGEACERYNQCCREGRVVAALHLTC